METEGWEKYYAELQRLPERLKKPVPFVAEALPVFEGHGVRRVLDLGCGAGRHCIYLARSNFAVVGADISESALRMSATRSRAEGAQNVELVRASMTNLPFKDGRFDAVISVSVIHHAVKRDVVRAVGEVHRVLREGGLFLANLVSVKDYRFGLGERIEDGTFRVLEDFEDARFEEAHHFYGARSARSLGPFQRGQR